MKLVPIKEMEEFNGVHVVNKVNEIVRFLNALGMDVILQGSGNKHDLFYNEDNDLIKRFGEWFPEDFVR